MNIRNHGDWVRYKPDRLPIFAPPNALFAHRVNDSTDWYDYVNSGDNFVENTIKLTVVDGRVGAAVIDPTLLFPGGATVLEISDVHVGDPQAAFGGKIYDPATKTFNDPPPFSFPNPLEDILKRLKALEAKGDD